MIDNFSITYLFSTTSGESKDLAFSRLQQKMQHKNTTTSSSTTTTTTITTSTSPS
jgi:hypothetical protein